MHMYSGADLQTSAAAAISRRNVRKQSAAIEHVYTLQRHNSTPACIQIYVGVCLALGQEGGGGERKRWKKQRKVLCERDGEEEEEESDRQVMGVGGINVSYAPTWQIYDT